jgi:nicotinate-nucleotide pyrophosphorylase (carboxylating)
MEVSGSAISILSTERLVLNFCQRLSGIATLSKQYADVAKPFNVKILDTRKTTPGLRVLEKWAVRTGGCQNHRTGLYDMIMLKDNHIDFCGGIEKAIHLVQKYLQDNNLKLPVEIETRNLKEVEEACSTGGINRIMLDNFTPEELKKAVSFIDKRFETEASGGITLHNLADYAKTGVDFISVGALTHSPFSVDISLKTVH